MNIEKDIKVNPDKIHLQSIRPLIDSIYIEPSVTLPPNINYNVSFEVGSGLSLESNAVKVVIKATFNGIDEQENAVGVGGAYSCEFILTVESLTDFVLNDQKENGVLVLHGTIAGTVLGICYSTFRGIVFTKSQTILSKGIVLPIVDPLKLAQIKVLASSSDK